MRQVKDHVCPGFAMRVPTICVLLSTLFQERISYFTVYMLLLQNTTITKHNMRINILKPSGLAKSQKLEVDKAILNSIYFLYVIYDISTCFSHKTPYKDISDNRHTDTYETFRTE
jgi:hypothetical protein